MTDSTVILAYPKIEYEKDYPCFWLPFSLLTIAKVVLDRKLANVIIFDGHQSNMSEWEAVLDQYLLTTSCIGVSILTGGGQIKHALEMVERVKSRKNCPPIVWGGPHVNVLPEQTLNHPLVDAVLIGPGQSSLPPFLEAIQGQRKFIEVPGLMMKVGEKRIHGLPNPPRVRQLGKYPWHLLNIEAYIRHDPIISPRTLNYVASQGCVYECQFCYELNYQKKYSYVDAETLLDDIEFLCKTYDLGGIKFYDADWFINLKRAQQFSQGLLDRNINIRWAASIHPNDILRMKRSHPSLLQLLAESGCVRLLMGIESGSNRVLKDVVKKNVTRDDIFEVVSTIAEHHILGSYTFIVGFPDETDDEQDETYQLIEKIKRIYPSSETKIHLFAPYPGTPLYEKAIQTGFHPPTSLEDWSDYDYYESQTPWTNQTTAEKARKNRMMISPPAKKKY